MKNKDFVRTLPLPEDSRLFFPWEPGGEGFYITENESRLIEKRTEQGVLLALFGFLAVVIFNITAGFIPVFTMGIAWINLVFLAMVISMGRFCSKKIPILVPVEHEDGSRQRRKFRRTLFIAGLVQSLVTFHGEAHFPDYPCIEVSITVAVFYVGMLITLILTKGRPLEYLARRRE